MLKRMTTPLNRVQSSHKVYIDGHLEAWYTLLDLPSRLPVECAAVENSRVTRVDAFGKFAGTSFHVCQYNMEVFAIDLS